MTNHIAKQFFELAPDSIVTDGARVYRVTHVISVDSVLVTDVASNEAIRLPIETLRPHDSEGSPTDAAVEAKRELADYSDEEWAVAQHRLQILKPYLDNPLRSEADARQIAAIAGVDKSTLYRWLATYTKAGHVSALVPGKRGRRRGTTLLPAPTEAVLTSVLEDTYLTGQKYTPSETIEEVKRRCRLARVVPPHDNTIRNRIAALPDRERFAKRGDKAKARRFVPYRGSFPGANQPLAVVQMDHTPADIICVDEVHRQPIARPFLTVAIDVFSRMVVGFYLSYDPPSATSVALCLAQAMCSKREYLANLEVPGTWPVWGRISTVHVDNAKEFRGAVLERGCEEYGINLNWRPVRMPHYGGHIENMMGRVAREMHTLPGTTFSNPQERGEYDSEAQSAMTLKELERHLADFFVNVYHLRRHSELGASPRRKWELGVIGDATNPGTGVAALPQDPEQIAIDFMPFHERTVQQYGLQIDKVFYYDPVLDSHINSTDPVNPKAKRLFTVRVDPRDISKVFFFDPDAGRYFPIPYRDLAHPAVSLYELREAQRTLHEQGISDTDEQQIFAAIERMRQRVDASVTKSKAARRQAARRPGSPAKPKTTNAPDVPYVRLGANSPVPPAFTPPPALVEDDPFSEPIRPFEDMRAHR